jgi:regulatory protein
MTIPQKREASGAASEPARALKRALGWLEYRPRSRAEIERKLALAGFPSQTIEATLEKLCSLGLLDDERFAESWCRTRVEQRGYGRLRVERELREKGVAPSLIREAVREIFGEEEGKGRAQRLLERRFREKDLTDPRILRRAAGFLQRRGYPSSVIAEVLRQPVSDE